MPPDALTRPVPGTIDASSPVVDWIGGAGFGFVLGILVGLSATPVVNVVVTGIVALLGGLFGLSDKVTSQVSGAAARRLAAFGAATAFSLPISLAARTNHWFAPSIAAQRQELAEMGFRDTVQVRDMLAYIRLGILPTPSALKVVDSQVAKASRSVLYADSASMCRSLQTDTTPAARLKVLDAASEKTKTMAFLIRGLSANDQRQSLRYAPLYLCLLR